MNFSDKSPSSSAKNIQALVPWVLWAAILSGFMMITFILGKGIPHGANPADSPVSAIAYVACVMTFVATCIRWLLIPRVAGSVRVLPVMIVGLALSEAPGLLSILIIPHEQQGTRMVVWVLALLSILQFMPIYANRDQRTKVL